jgi:2-desacetyl-2-hydroxyethyl bacteriochlorophyllide A dehydrogenase
MKAAIYQGVGKVQVVEVPDPKAGPKDVVIQVISSGICGTDITEYHVANSGAVEIGHQFGHEFAGIVVEAGSEVKGIRTGMRVTANPMTATRIGRRNACMIGGFSQYVLVEDAAIGYNIYPLPDQLTFEDGALVEPAAVGMHGVNTAQPKQDDQVIILGAGPIGLSALAGMKALGVKNVVVSDISEFRLEKARALGADAVHNPKNIDLVDFMEELCPDQMGVMGYFDVVVDAAGFGPALEDIILIAKGGARISIVALHKSAISLEPMFFIMKDLQMKGSVGYPTEFPQVIDFMASSKIDLKPTITHRFPLSEINAALKITRKQDEAIKVLIDMTA